MARFDYFRYTIFMVIKNTRLQVPFLWIDMKVDNFEEFAKAVHSWNVDFLQLDGGTFYFHLQQFILPEVEITHALFDCHLDQKGYSPEGMWTFAILGENSSMFKFHHKTTQDTSTMLIYPPGGKINGVTHEGFHVYIFSIKESHFQKLTQKLGLDNIEEKLAKIDRVQLEPSQAESLREQLKDILAIASNVKNKVITEEERNLLLHFLPVKFLKEIGAGIGCAKEKIIQDKDMLFMEIRAYMHTHMHEPITIVDIAAKFNLSGRTLRHYFLQELNTSPKQYLTILRLTKIRDELKVQTMEQGIIEQTARRFGFNQMGHFSKTYKSYFGELPSETLRTSIKKV